MAEKRVFSILYFVLSIRKNTEYRIQNTEYTKARGYTLIEFLVVVGILAMVVGSTILFLTSVLRGTNKSNITAEVKQNGQAVLDSLERQIRGANEVILKLGDPGYMILVKSDDISLHVKCLGQLSGPNPKNARLGIVKADVNEDPATSNYISISNDDAISGVNIENCRFNVIPADLSAGESAPAVVSVEFEATQGISAPSRTDFGARVKFSTTISLRTYE